MDQATDRKIVSFITNVAGASAAPEEIDAGIQAIEREAEGLLDGVLMGARR